MKTRIIKTSFWSKMVALKAPKDARLLYSYLLTCPHINLSGIFELDEQYILMETGLTHKEFEKALVWLTTHNKVRFHKGWFLVINADEHNNYKASPKNEIAYDREVSNVPKGVMEVLKKETDGDTSIDSTMDTPPIVTINHKSEIRNQKEGDYKGKQKVKEPQSSVDYLLNIPESDLESLMLTYEASKNQIKNKAEELFNYCKSKGKLYKDYKAFLMNALNRDFGKRKSQIKPRYDYVYDKENNRYLQIPVLGPDLSNGNANAQQTN